MDCEKATYAVATRCRMLGVSPSDYWAWRKRYHQPSTRAQVDAALSGQIVAIHQASRGAYGAQVR